MADEVGSEGRLSRWSKRKIAIAREEIVEDEAETVEAPSPEELSEQEAELQAELQANREAAEAVDLESLNEESDFSVFMKAGVPEMLKKQAMASLWRTSPVFANIDGLVDYDDDFASPDLIMKTFKSAYQAGRGYLDLFKEKEESEEEELADTESVDENPDSDEDLATGSQQEPDEAENETPEEIEQIAETDLEVGELVEEEEEPTPPPKVSLRRRLELEQTAL